jgi:hypothetical protein
MSISDQGVHRAVLILHLVQVSRVASVNVGRHSRRNNYHGYRVVVSLSCSSGYVE